MKDIKFALFFLENYLHFMNNCIRPPYRKLKPLESGFIEKSNFENNRDPLGLGGVKTAMSNIFMHDQQPVIAMITRSSP